MPGLEEQKSEEQIAAENFSADAFTEDEKGIRSTIKDPKFMEFDGGAPEGGAEEEEVEGDLTEEEIAVAEAAKIAEEEANAGLSEEEKKAAADKKVADDKAKAEAGGEGDLSDEELLKKALDGEEIPVSTPEVETLGKELGISVKDGEKITSESIKAEFTRLKSFENESDADLKELKVFKALNPEGTVFDFAQQFVSPHKMVLAMDDRTLYYEYLVNAKKMGNDEAREAVAKKMEDEPEKFKEEVTAIRDVQKVKDDEFELGKKDKFEQAKKQYNNSVTQNRKNLFEAMTVNKDKMLGGAIKMQNKDILQVMDAVKSGEAAKLVKDPKNYAEFIFFKQNQEKIMKLLSGQGLEEGKGLVLNELAGKTVKKPSRSATRPDPSVITNEGWA